MTSRKYPQYRTGLGRSAHVHNLIPLDERRPDDRLTEKETSAYTGYSVWALREWRQRKAGTLKGPAYCKLGVGKRGYYLAADVKSFVDSLETARAA